MTAEASRVVVRATLRGTPAEHRGSVQTRSVPGAREDRSRADHGCRHNEQAATGCRGEGQRPDGRRAPVLPAATMSGTTSPSSAIARSAPTGRVKPTPQANKNAATKCRRRRASIAAGEKERERLGVGKDEHRARRKQRSHRRCVMQARDCRSFRTEDVQQHSAAKAHTLDTIRSPSPDDLRSANRPYGERVIGGEETLHLSGSDS